jgi:hypothetical protein
MDDKQLQLFAHEIANQIAFHNWAYWLVLLAVTLIGSFFGSYAKKRAEHAATKAGLKEILRQLELTTRTTEGIRAVVSLGEWSERERRTLRRVKLEELMLTAHRVNDWLEAEKNRLFYLSDDREAMSPLPLVVTLARLFFPELQPKVLAFNSDCLAHHAFFTRVHSKLIVAKAEAAGAAVAAGKAAGNWQGWQDDLELSVSRAQGVVRDTCLAELQEGSAKVQAAFLALDEVAAVLMAKIIVAPSSS